MLYEYCADARTIHDITAAFGADAWIGPALHDFVEKDLMLFLDGRYLSLAVPANPTFEMTAGPQSAVLAQRPPMDGFVPAIELLTLR
jgi:hypothetical protein